MTANGERENGQMDMAKPPLGLRPRRFVLESCSAAWRRDEIMQAIRRRCVHGMDVPLAWAVELIQIEDDSWYQPNSLERIKLSLSGSITGEGSMKSGFKSEHWNDEAGNPAGGASFGNGFAISWQNGPLGRGNERREPNGAFVEDVIEAVADRIRYYQDSRFASVFNAKALLCLEEALMHLDQRTKDREARAGEGTHKE